MPARSPVLLRIALRGAVVAGLTAGAIGPAVLDRTMVLSVDGETRTVRTFAGTVGGALDRAGIEVGEHDTLAPGAATRLRNGGEVTLRRGRLLSLTVDGQPRSVWVTARSVEEALDQLGLRAEGAVLSASRSRPIGLDGLALDVRTPTPVTVVADGTATPVTTTAVTVADLLAERGIALAPSDLVSLPLDARPAFGAEVRVTRLRTEQRLEQASIPAGSVERPDPTLTLGSRRPAEPGRDGVLERTFAVSLTDGVETGRALVAERVLTAAVPAVVLVGTKPVPPPPPPVPVTPPGTAGLDWAALARCESGGNPRAVSPNGLYFGLYQFAIGTWRGVGGTGSPIDAAPAEQTARAAILYSRSGRSPWPVCGRYL